MRWCKSRLGCARVPRPRTAILLAPFLPLLAGCAASLSSPPPEPAVQDQPATHEQAAASWDTDGAYLQVEGGRLWFLDSGGSGPAVLFLHPFTGTHEIWINQYRHLTASGFRVIVLDGRGAGRSDAIPASAETQIADIDALLGRLNIDAVHIVGAAAGGMQAAHYAVSRPGKVATLTLIGTIISNTDPDYIRAQQRLLSPQFHALPPEIKELGPSYRFENAPGTARWLDIESRSARNKLIQFPPEQRAAIRAKGFNNSITVDRLAAFRNPILLLYGGADLYSPPAAARVMASALPNARLTILPEAGHAPHWEQEARFNAVLVHFLLGK